MPPIPLLPNQPAGRPDWFSPAQSPASSAQTPGRTRYIMTKNGPVWLPQNMQDISAEEARLMSQVYDRAIDEQAKLLATAVGLQRQQIEAQIKDLEEGRKNALAIADMQDKASRYGVDVGSRDRMAQLLENQRQFNATHEVDLQRLGLDRAKTATDYLSTPDRFIQAGDYLNLSGRVLAGQPGSAPYGSNGPAQPKAMEDYAVLEGGGNPGRQVDPSAAASSGGAGADARVKALTAVMKASPPSADAGHDANDYAVLSAARAIYGMNLTPQQQASFRANPQATAIHNSAGARLGENPDAWWKDQRRSLPGQGSARAA